MPHFPPFLPSGGWAAHYEQRWSLSDHSELNAGIARSEHPYDGNPESRTSVTVNYEGRF